MEDNSNVSKIDLYEVKAAKAEKEFNDLMDRLKYDYDFFAKATQYLDIKEKEKNS